jgi:hypothetical protein
MRFRVGLLIGLAVGYYYGAKAGRERYEQLDEWLDKVRGTTTYQDLAIKLNDGFREGTTAARRLIEDTAFGGDAPTGVFVDRDPTTPMDRPIYSDPTLN